MAGDSPLTGLKACSMRRYLRWFSAVFFLLLGVSALTNAVVDPYLVYRIGPASWNAGKRQQEHWISRAETAARDGYDVLIAGDSRALNGLSPEHPALTSLGRVHNIAVAGSSLYETQKLLDIALTSGRPPRTIIWAMPCNPALLPYQVGDDFEWSRASGRHVFPERHLHYLLSLTATNDSLHALGCAFNGHSYGLEHGFLAHSKPATSEGQFMACIPRMVKPLTGEQRTQRLQEAREILAAAAERCEQHGTELILVFPPVHASFLQGIVPNGGWQLLQDYKSIAVDIAQETNRSRQLVQVWDFTSFSGLTNEPVAIAQNEPMRWYLDSSHFNGRLGDLVLNRIFDVQAASDAIDVASFGAALTATNLSPHLAQQEAAADRFRSQETIRFAETPEERSSVRR